MPVKNFEFGALEIGVSFTSEQQLYRKQSESTAVLVRTASGIETTERVEQQFSDKTVVLATSLLPGSVGSLGFLIGQLRLTQSHNELQSDRITAQVRLTQLSAARPVNSCPSTLSSLEQRA